MEREYFTITEVSEKLGLSTTAIKAFIRKGKLKAYRPHKKMLVQKSDLDAFMLASAVSVKVS